MTALHETEAETETETERAFAVSRRAQAMPASPIRKLAPLAELARARGTKVYHLNIGQPDIETPACMLDRLKQIDDKVLEYSPSTGTSAFLESLRQYYAQRFEEGGRTGRGRIFEDLVVDLLQAVEHARRRLDVRLADVEVIDLRAARPGQLRQRCELPDRRRR